MSYLLYSQLNTLEKISFIAGTLYTLEYMVYDEDGVTPLDLNSSTTKLYLCPYGQQNFIAVDADGVLSVTTGLFTVELTKAMTQNLSGTYIQQPTVIDFEGKEFRLGQGEIVILPRIQ